MNVYLFENNKIISFELPSKKIGDFWLKDTNGTNMANIFAQDGNWMLAGSRKTKIYDASGNTENIVLKPKKYYIVEKDKQKYLLFCDYNNDMSFRSFFAESDKIITVGSDEKSNICIPLSNILPVHLKIKYNKQNWNIEVTDGAVCYLNDDAIKKKNIVGNNGDLLNIYGIKIFLIHEGIFINDPFKNIVINNLSNTEYIVEDELVKEEIENKPYYEEEDYFFKSPRVQNEIEKLRLKIDSPTSEDPLNETEFWVTLAPMITMIASTLMNLSNTFIVFIQGKKTFWQILPSLVLTFCMIFTMIIWPNIIKKFQKKTFEEKKMERLEEYKAYVNKKDKLMFKEYENQKRIHNDNLLSTDVCYDMIMNKRRILWSRRMDQADFLNVRVGIGDVEFEFDVSYASDSDSAEKDGLKRMVDRLVESYKLLNEIPMSYSFRKHPITCINGLFPKYLTFVNNILLQMMAHHGYDDLKIVIFSNENNKHRWDYLLKSPYCFSNDKKMRFFATNVDELEEVSNYLSQIFSTRKALKGNVIDSLNNSHYFIIVDDIDLARRSDIIGKLLTAESINGFSLVVLEEKLSKVPEEITNFIIVGDKSSVIMDSVVNTQKKFVEETNDSYDMNACTKILSNLPLHLREAAKQLPTRVTFLEMFKVGRIEQLNIQNRWRQNDVTKSIRAEIGIGANGGNFYLDLHEKAHGPHGLVAGMTGSGKSEFIITYVLSMAVNYSPEEVQFVLIDYKGGGLASAFVDSETGKKIPHIAGTITNLDKSEIHRALASINSELRRRQEVFNDAKIQTGEGTIDIYKYQKYYREGVLLEPMSHLIIVCDEFAELKSQQPDFMNDLVSAARIGRSLGVHLILATQKPSGVVDAQIWSNAKFKVCLKVQDKEDSNEMIRNDLAAEIKQVGRFYLLVGYSEYFATGQSAWAGAQYYPNNEFKKDVDKNIYMIDNVGSVNRTIINSDTLNIKSEGEELTNIVKNLIAIGESNPNLKLRQLWLDKIPAKIYVDDLKKKYNYKKTPFIINPIIGEFDSPVSQMQGLLTLNFNESGNTLLYGMNESGKDEFLQTIVYSMIDTYTTDELNLYLVDFGAETLINYMDAPQVGDVVLSTDEEKIYNLIKKLALELMIRKKAFTAYGGNYSDYIKYSGKKLPSIVVIVNEMGIMNEIYNDIVDKYIPIIREGSKYGIYFLITGEAPSSIKSKVIQSCKNSLCLQLSNDNQYRDILGKTGGIVPSRLLGRGLVKLEGVCEFQTATVSKDKIFYEFIKEYLPNLQNKGYKKAPVIHVMPETVELKPMMENYIDIHSVPIGVIKESLNIMYYDFGKNVISVMSANEFDILNVVIKNMINVFSQNSLFSTTVVDANNFFDEFDYLMTYLNGNYNELVDALTKMNDSIQSVLVENNMNYKSIDHFTNNLIVVIGFEKFYGKLDDEHKKALHKIFADNKENPKISFLFFDLPGVFKKYEAEEWYKSNYDNTNGIWIGPGLGQQFVIKAISVASSLSVLTPEYGIVIKKGNATTVKIINEIK